MADKDVPLAQENGGVVGLGLLAGLLLAGIAAFFFIYFLGGFAGHQGAVDANVQVPGVAPAGGGN